MNPVDDTLSYGLMISLRIGASRHALKIWAMPHSCLALIFFQKKVGDGLDNLSILHYFESGLEIEKRCVSKFALSQWPDENSAWILKT